MLTNAAGCDSTVTLNLTINNSITSTDTQVACDSYTWIDGNTYTSSNNTATHTVVGVAPNGCDSIYMLDLTINNSTAGTDTQVACDSYTWIDGNTYTSNNTTATHMLTNAAGCDSTVTLNLTINTVDVSVTANSPMLTANAVGANYQWIDCDNGNSYLAGETSQNYTATINGNYAVEVTQNGCLDTSNCVAVVGISILENDLTNRYQVYPNPTNDVVYLELDQTTTGEYQMELLNILGEVLSQERVTTLKTKIQLPKERGIYFIKLISADKTSIVKVLKQ